MEKKIDRVIFTVTPELRKFINDERSIRAEKTSEFIRRVLYEEKNRVRKRNGRKPKSN